MFKYFCHGGPWHGHTLHLASPATLVFTVKGRTGRYRGGRAHYSEYAVPRLTPVAIDVRYGHDLIWEQADV